MPAGIEVEQPSAKMPSVRVLIVDDFAPWRRFVIVKLRENPDLRVIGVVSDGLEAVRKAEELQPDVILLDINLPGLSGIEAARKIRERAPNSRILFVSLNPDPDMVRAALAAGGQGYVVKVDAEWELLTAVDAVVLGKTFVSRRAGSFEMLESPGGAPDSSEH